MSIWFLTLSNKTLLSRKIEARKIQVPLYLVGVATVSSDVSFTFGTVEFVVETEVITNVSGFSYLSVKYSENRGR